MNYSEMFQLFYDVTKKYQDLDKRISEDAILRKKIMDSYGIKNEETVNEMFKMNNLLSWSSGFANKQVLDFKEYVKLSDAMRTISKNPDLFSKSLTYGSILSSFSQRVNPEIFNDFSSNNSGTVVQEKYFNEELNGENIDIKRPYFFNLAMKINLVINITDSEIENEQNEAKETWKKRLRPALSLFMTLFLSWGMGDTPITENMFYKSIEPVFEIFEQDETLDLEENIELRIDNNDTDIEINKDIMLSIKNNNDDNQG